jgi:7-cyano-7-deazaguanine reductase
MKWLGKKNAYQRSSQNVSNNVTTTDILDRVLRGQQDDHCKGHDIWLCYEISWLSKSNKPTYKMGELIIPIHSQYILESKSVKLYLNQFNCIKFESEHAFINHVKTDISTTIETEISFQLYDPMNCELTQIEGECIDSSIINEKPDGNPLQTDPTIQVKNKTVMTHLFRSNCPITHQPDWASIIITYSGSYIQQNTLLAYLLSYRDHQKFHEACMTTIYKEIMKHCRPNNLKVYGAFTRRGGIAIHPVRMSQNSTVRPYHLLKT